MAVKLFFYVQHLLGIGHLNRAALIANAVAAGGGDVVLVMGGMPVDIPVTAGVKTVQLPPVKAGPDGFSQLVDRDNQPIDDAFKHARIDQLLACLDREKPDILMIEAFPFGRRQMRFELLPLLEAARKRRPRPRIVASIRDILQHRPLKRERETLDYIEQYFDKILVHGDPEFVRLDETFSLPIATEKLHYTGIVAASSDELRKTAEQCPQQYDVIVSAGGGAVGAHLLEAVSGVNLQGDLGELSWLIITGPHAPAGIYENLNGNKPAGVHVSRYREDFRQLLSRARLSISQAGYNTMADILQADIASIVIPYARDGETEQALRAQILKADGLCDVITEAELTPRLLEESVRHLLNNRAQSKRGLPKLDGAAQTARLVLQSGG